MAEGAALEMPCTGNRTVGSNPTPSAILIAVLDRSQTLPVGEKDPDARRRLSRPGGEKGPVARRRPKTAREAYSLYVERAVEGANEANGPLSASGKDGRARRGGSGAL